MQRAILAALWELSAPLDSGLPIPGVKASARETVGADRRNDRRNVRRAIRTLLLRGALDLDESGERIRLSKRTAMGFCIIPPVSPEPIDKERAKAILQTHASFSPVVAYRRFADCSPSMGYRAYATTLRIPPLPL